MLFLDRNVARWTNLLRRSSTLGSANKQVKEEYYVLGYNAVQSVENHIKWVSCYHCMARPPIMEDNCEYTE
jgi:hypothetical protein